MADATIVNVALPSIGNGLHFSPLGLTWVVNSYTFAFGGCLLLGGRAAGLLGPRRVFTAGMSVFALGSLACGLAGTAPALIAGRALQGLGGALACPAALAVVIQTFREPRERARALAAWSGCGAGAVALGPMIGGALTGAFTWAAVFFVPLPVCLAAVAAGARSLPGLAGGAHARQGVARPRSTPGRHPGAHAGQPRGFPVRRTAAADLVLALTSAALVGACYACTLWLQEVLHYSPELTGAAFLPLSTGIVAGAALAPALMRRYGFRVVTAAGLVVAAAAMALLARSPAQAGLADLIPWLALLAAGFGLQSVPVSAVATAVPGREAIASAIYQTAGQLGGGAGLAVLARRAAATTVQAGGARGGTSALVAGYDAVFAGGAVALTAATLVIVFLLRPDDLGPAPQRGRLRRRPARAHAA
jgi:predicted MFS family arabinose efflux permease